MPEKEQTIREKLLYIQSNLKAPKNQYNSFGKYAYRNCEDIQDAVKPLLAKQKCVLVLSDQIEMIGEHYYIKATARLIDCENSEIIENEAFAKEDASLKGMSSAQVTGSTSSYARKYALNGLFCISDEKDNDTEEYKKENEEKERLAQEAEMLKNPITQKEISELRKIFRENGIDESKVLAVYKLETIEAMTGKMYRNVLEHRKDVKEACSV